MGKTIIYLALTVGSIVGSYIPVMFGGSALGGWSILGGLIGGIVGVWVGVKINNNY